MITANRIDPRGSGFYLTFDSPSDFLATLGGRENPCTAIFHPRDFPTNFVDPSGLDTSILVGGRPVGTMTSWMGTKLSLYPVEVYQDGAFVGKFSVTRAPHDKGAPVSRYGENGEVPPGEYFLNEVTDPGHSHRLELSDKFNNYGVINGPEGRRTNIQFHPQANSEGCMTVPITGKVRWTERDDDNAFWKFRNTVIDDVSRGKAKVFILGRHSDEGVQGFSRDVATVANFMASNGFGATGAVGPARAGISPLLRR